MFKLLQRLIQLFMKGGRTGSGRVIAKNISKAQRLKQFQRELEMNPQFQKKFQYLSRLGKDGKQEHVKFIKDYLAGRKKMSDYVKSSKYDKKWGNERDWQSKSVLQNPHGGQGYGGGW
jgi:hypothetical protein